MNILENSLLTGIFLVLNLASLSLYLLSYLWKEYRTSFFGMICQTITVLLYFFLSAIKWDFFLLAGAQDFTANLVYLISISSAFLNAVFGMKMFYQHRVVSAIIIQLGMFFAAVLLATQVSDTAYNYFNQKRLKEELEKKQGFNQTGDFENRNKPKEINPADTTSQ